MQQTGISVHTYQLLVSALILTGLLFRGLVGVLSAASLIHFGGGSLNVGAPSERLETNYFN